MRSLWAGACAIGAFVASATVLPLGCASSISGAAEPKELVRAYADALADGRVDDAYQMLSDDAKRSVSLDAFRRMVRDNPEEVVDVVRALRRSATATTVTATVLTSDGEKLELVFEAGRWRVDASGIDRYGQATPRQAIEGFLRAFDRKRYDVIMRYVPARELEGLADLDWGEGPPGSEPSVGSDGEPQPAALDSADGGGLGGGGPTHGTGGTLDPEDAGPTDPAGGGLSEELLRRRWEGDQKPYIARIVQAIKAALPTARIEETGDRAAMPYGAGGTVLFVREDGLWKIEDLQ